MGAGAFEAGFDCYDKKISQIVKTETSQDTVVPDTMPDIAEILSAGGFVMLRSKDISDGYAELEAVAAVDILYKPEDGSGVRSLEISIPVRITVENAAVSSTDMCTALLCITGIDAKLLNPRKVLVKAEIGGEIAVYSQMVMSIGCCNAEQGRELYTRTAKALITPVESVKEKTFVLTDEYTLPAQRAAVREILSRRVSLCVDEVRPAGGRLLFKGSAKCTLLYEAVDGTAAQAEFTSTYSQLIDCQLTSDEVYAELAVMLTGAYFEVQSAGEGRSISAELHIVAQSVCRVPHEVEYTADAYSNLYALELEREERDGSAVLCRGELRQTLTEHVDTPSPIAEILDVYAFAQQLEADGGFVKQAASVHLIYRGNDGDVVSVRRRMELQFTQELGQTETLEAGIADLSDILATTSGSGAEIRIRGVLPVTVTKHLRLSMVAQIHVSEEMRDLSALPSLVLLRAGEQDDLWALAKENCSSVEAITEINGLEQAENGWEKVILIPKTK